jgi:hypothetical protein
VTPTDKGAFQENRGEPLGSGASVAVALEASGGEDEAVAAAEAEAGALPGVGAEATAVAPAGVVEVGSGTFRDSQAVVHERRRRNDGKPALITEVRTRLALLDRIARVTSLGQPPGASAGPASCSGSPMKRPPPPLRLTAIPAAAVVLASACAASQAPDARPALDLSPARGETFNPDELIPLAAFEDAYAFGSAEVQTFFSRTPYRRQSFLATYESSGVFAADAIVAAATTYRINPIFFLVRAEVDSGLIAAERYPLPSRPVEYVFGCGCSSPSVCDPAFAGFDKQVDCLGSALRTSLDEISATGHTAGGWGPGLPDVTLDGVHVTPADASTAALYQYDPIVGKGKSDNWLVWNVWQLYANALMYVTPPSAGAGATAQIGDACIAATDCAFASPLCATGTGYPGGLCTSKCNGSCPASGSFCADFTSQGYCLAVCNPTDPASCREGYTCTLISQYGGPSPTQSANVCTPM